MPVKALNVAEKPSVAKEVSRILSNGAARSRRGRARFNPIWEFGYTIQGTPCDMVFTSVAGHLMELDFTAQHKRWRSCNPVELYQAPVVKAVPDDKSDLKQHLQELARQCQWLILWLDCDREGENISFEVIEVCTGANRNMRVMRARFSALIPRELQRAMQQLVAPNAADAAAVDARQEIDLRVGASFTRLQTLLLQDKFDWAAGGVANDRPVLSYGPCQFPTLGLIVQRAWEIQSHVSEPFWYIFANYRPAADANAAGAAGGGQQQQASCEFKWARDRLFDRDVATMLYEAATQEPVTATVMQVQGRQATRRAPCPLATLEMCKSGSKYLRLSGERIMKLAEELYQAGFISYPRTETDVYDPGMDLRAIVQEHSHDARWGAHATAILNGAMWQPPRPGGHDDKAHPPIHPTRHSAGEPDWAPEKRALYEFIVRHFLASCSKDAVGQETNVTIDIGGEAFRTTGLMVTERNWLLVFTYTTWGGNANLPHFVEGMQFAPTEVSLREGATQPPPRLFERDLISAMERHGIGTDATVAEHIQKQLERGYAVKDDATQTFAPTALGESLISSYRRMGLDNLWKPDLRGRIEQGISRIAAGQVTKDVILQQAIQAFRADFQAAMQRTQDMIAEVGRFFNRLGGQQQQQQQPGPFGGPGGGPGGGGGWGGGGGGGFGPGPGGGGGGGPAGGGGFWGPGPGPPGDLPPGGGYDGSSAQGGSMGGGPAGGFGGAQPGMGGAPAAAAAAAGCDASGQPQPLGTCPKCGGLLMLQGGPGAGVAGQARVVCQADLPCSFRMFLPRSVASAAVCGEECQRCRHGQVMKAALKLRMTLLPPGLFQAPDYTGCLLCDPTLQQLLEMSGAGAQGGGRPRAPPAAAAGAAGRGNGSSNPPAGAWQQQQQQYNQAPPAQQWQPRAGPQQRQQQQQQQQQQQYQTGPVARTMVPPPMGSQFPVDDWGTGQAAKARKQGGSGSKRGASGGGTTKAKGGSGGRARGSKASKAAAAAGGGAAAAAAGGPEGGVPLCPRHGEPVRVGTSNTAKNPGRAFYKCNRAPEDGGEACLKFAWADEFQPQQQQQPPAKGRGGAAAAAAGGGSRAGAAAGGGRKKGAGARAGSKRSAAAAAAGADDGGGWHYRNGGAGGGGGGGGQFVTATGASMPLCFRCQQPGHYASNCPNS